MGAIILAGGKSERMGTPKADLRLGERSLLEWVITPLRSVTQNILIVSKIPPASAPDDIVLIKDELPDFGPLAGLKAALEATADELNFVTGCDTPFLAVPFIKALLEKANGYDAVIPLADDRQHPLCAVYNKRCLDSINEAINAKKQRISSFFEAVRVNFVPDEELRKYDPKLHSLINLNTPKDYEKAAAILASLV